MAIYYSLLSCAINVCSMPCSCGAIIFPFPLFTFACQSVDPGTWSADANATRERRKVHVRRGAGAASGEPAATANPFAGIALSFAQPPGAAASAAAPPAAAGGDDKPAAEATATVAKAENGEADEANKTEEVEAEEQKPQQGEAAAAAAAKEDKADTANASKAEEDKAGAAATSPSPASSGAAPAAATAATPAASIFGGSAGTTPGFASLAAGGASGGSFNFGFGGGGGAAAAAPGNATSGIFGSNTTAGSIFGGAGLGGNGLFGSNPGAGSFGGGFSFPKLDAAGGGALGKPLFGVAGASAGGGAEEGGEGEERPEAFEPSEDPSIKPVVQLAVVQKVTGEENEQTIYAESGKLFEYDAAASKWRQRGSGELRVNVSADGTTSRVVMRQSGNLRLLLNARVTVSMPVQRMQGANGVTFGCVNTAAPPEPNNQQQQAAAADAKSDDKDAAAGSSKVAAAAGSSLVKTWAFSTKGEDKMLGLMAALEKAKLDHSKHQAAASRTRVEAIAALGSPDEASRQKYERIVNDIDRNYTAAITALDLSHPGWEVLLLARWKRRSQVMQEIGRLQEELLREQTTAILATARNVTAIEAAPAHHQDAALGGAVGVPYKMTTRDMKLLPCEAVTITPGQGDNSHHELKRRRSLRLQEQRRVKQRSVLPGPDKVGSQGLGNGNHTNLVSIKGSSSTSSSGGGNTSNSDDAGSSGVHITNVINVPLEGKVPGGLEQLTRKRGSKVLLPLELCGFGDVGLTGRCVGYGCYGSVLEGTIGGVAAVIKLFEQKRRGAVEAFTRELAVYLCLGSSISSNSSSNLQGAPLVPRLLRYGMFAHTGALFLALTDEGDDLEAGASRSTTVAGDAAASGSSGRSLRDAGISPKLRTAMLRALRVLHRAGVLHGDIRLSNFVMGRDGVVKLVDLGNARVVGGLEAGSSSYQAAMEAEVQAVHAL
ncbi:hypothetical protein VOLCADRAFT_106848 [Volvox carteri f. nagariensis]|uniref:Protein kinase domain-containing protein n=1 Tax=Volvox carteri f. nagariensis TaxID=3068 RepID=D8UA47_VOLCA|nr:uncharacterized protein VOLCADRAFT_106848 [Volvox carteri f. nagariensis]EFJ43412.1 hypothetical protein VOLCADRAFT_106848 [Volvox carteri f. nagariensis]|eukprot:XP_002955559.1 hypothetical protein VOLCADRAFT_106848 [Volvox carteri f. nagariensis]